MISQDIIELKKSNIDGAGEGLFLKRRTTKGKIITKYPGVKMSVEQFNLICHKAITDNNYESIQMLQEYTQFCGREDGVDYVKVASKSLRDISNGVGHLVNDGGDININLLKKVCKLLQTLPTTPPMSKTAMSHYTKVISATQTATYLASIRYLITGYKKRNVCVMSLKNGEDSIDQYLVSDREILRDDELYHFYGMDYWLKSALFHMCVENEMDFAKCKLPKCLTDLIQPATLIKRMGEQDIWNIIKHMTTHIGIKNAFSPKLQLEHLSEAVIEPMKRMEQELDYYMNNPFNYSETFEGAEVQVQTGDDPQDSISVSVQVPEQGQELPCPL